MTQPARINIPICPCMCHDYYRTYCEWCGDVLEALDAVRWVRGNIMHDGCAEAYEDEGPEIHWGR